MATEVVTMGTELLKFIRKYQQTFTGSFKSVNNSFTALAKYKCFDEGALSRRNALNFDVQLQLIIEIGIAYIGGSAEIGHQMLKWQL